jgi:hypothetical protein
MEVYTLIEEHGSTRQRRGQLIQSASGLYYFNADYNKAKLWDSVRRYRMDVDGKTLRLVDYRRKKYIDDPVRAVDESPNGSSQPPSGLMDRP